MRMLWQKFGVLFAIALANKKCTYINGKNLTVLIV